MGVLYGQAKANARKLNGIKTRVPSHVMFANATMYISEDRKNTRVSLVSTSTKYIVNIRQIYRKREENKSSSYFIYLLFFGYFRRSNSVAWSGDQC